MAEAKHQHHREHGHDHEQATFGPNGPHAHGDEFTANNKAHWDEFASKYTSQQWQRDMIDQITSFIVAHVDWIGIKKTDRVLDYACGPGTITAALSSHATYFQGIDLSDNMAKAYHLRFQDSANILADAVVGDLLTETPPEHLSELKYLDFDIAAIGLGFHHFENLQLCLTRLIERLKPGGTLLILDLLTHEPEEAYKTIVAHHGFSEGQMKQLFGDAGLTDVDVVVMEKEVMMHGTKPRKVFMARGRKAG